MNVSYVIRRNIFMTRDEVVSAAEFAAVSDIDCLTGDRIEALTGGHGMLNLSVYSVANVIIEELENGGHLDVKNANTKTLPMETVLRKCIDICKKGGCDPANAALISAVMMYIAGSKAQVGVPAGNRKLGAMARIIAGNDRCGVAAVPTAKANNKLSGFPAVMAVYKAMQEKKLTQIDGNNVPGILLGSVMFGHSTLGEDIVFRELAENGAKAGTQGMIDAYVGAGMHPDPFTCALFGAAAILEIVHPDAAVSEEIGPYGKITSAYVAGKAAAETAGLPEKLHVRGTDEEYLTGQLIGDLGLIIKDVGGPAVIGMMALEEIMSIFKEGIAGGSASHSNTPLGHICGYAVALMKALMFYKDDEKALKAVLDDRRETSFNPEYAFISINLTARKAETICRGKVTRLMIQGTDPVWHYQLHKVCCYSYDRLSEGASLEDVVKELDKEKMLYIEKNAGEFFSKEMGVPVTIHVTECRPGARRTSNIARKFLAFDGYFDVTVTRGDEKVELKGLADSVVPAVARGEITDLEWALNIAVPVCSDHLFGGNHMMNIILPAAVAAIMGVETPESAGDIVNGASVITACIPGSKARAQEVAERAVRIASFQGFC